MARGPSSPQIIVVHGRQVVVHEAVDMDQFNSRRGRIQLSQGCAEGFSGQVHEHRPQSLAAAERAVAHGFPQPLRARVGQLEAALQHLLDPGPVLGQALGEVGSLIHLASDPGVIQEIDVPRGLDRLVRPGGRSGRGRRIVLGDGERLNPGFPVSLE